MLNCSTMAKWTVGLAFLAISAQAADEVPPPADGAAPAPAAAVTPPPAAEAKSVAATPAVEAAKAVKTPAPVENEDVQTAAEKEAINLTKPPRSYSGTRDPIRHLGRGVSNVLTGVWEVPFNIYNVNKSDGDVAAVTYGLFRGIWRCCVREMVGVGEIITFPFGWQPVIEPEFPFEPTPATDWRLRRPGRLTED